MKRHCFTGKQRAFLWSGLALLALLLLAALYLLTNRPAFTPAQAIREAERREATQQTTLLDTVSMDDTDLFLLGNQDVLMVVPFPQHVLSRLGYAGHSLLTLDPDQPLYDQDQEEIPLRCAQLILEGEDNVPRFQLLVGITDQPEAVAVTLAPETGTLWSGTVPLEESPFGYRYFWVWADLPPQIKAETNTDYTVTLLDEAGQPLDQLTGDGFSLWGHGRLP